MNYIYYFLILLLVSCGGADIENVPEKPEVIVIDNHKGMLTIGPPIGAAPEAVAYVEEIVGCNILTWCEIEPDILVKFDDRECGHCGAGTGRISINDPERCEWVEFPFGLGLAVHELVHVLGHWHHDENIYSVMNGTVQLNWYLEEDDIQYLRDKYCNILL